MKIVSHREERLCKGDDAVKLAWCGWRWWKVQGALGIKWKIQFSWIRNSCAQQ